MRLHSRFWQQLLGCTSAAVLASFHPAAAQSGQPGDCTFESVGRDYDIPPALLYVLSKIESGSHARSISKPNANGSIDMGSMGVNSIHWGELRKFGILPEHLLDECIGLRSGAWVFANKRRQAKGDLWKAVRLYNPGDPQYVAKVYAELLKIGAVAPLRN